MVVAVTSLVAGQKEKMMPITLYTSEAMVTGTPQRPSRKGPYFMSSAGVTRRLCSSTAAEMAKDE